jgi:hypothetical protein
LTSTNDSPWFKQLKVSKISECRRAGGNAHTSKIPCFKNPDVSLPPDGTVSVELPLQLWLGVGGVLVFIFFNFLSFYAAQTTRCMSVGLASILA